MSDEIVIKIKANIKHGSISTDVSGLDNIKHIEDKYLPIVRAILISQVDEINAKMTQRATVKICEDAVK